jgi:RNA polymerase sigma-70 factor (ECF subfamily)
MQQSPDDKQLIQSLQQGHSWAMRRIFEQYYPEVRLSVLRLVNDAGVAEDLAQDLFLHLWNNREHMVITASIDAYLRKAATNRALNYLRDKRRFDDMEPEEDQILSNEPDEIQRLEGLELQVAIDKAIDALPARCRLVFVLSRFEDMKYAEIADELGISVKTVENQMSKALRNLRVALKQHIK